MQIQNKFISRIRIIFKDKITFMNKIDSLDVKKFFFFKSPKHLNNINDIDLLSSCAPVCSKTPYKTYIACYTYLSTKLNLEKVQV